MNSGTLKLNGTSLTGILIRKNTIGRNTDDNNYHGSEIIFSNPMEISGSSSTGIVFNKFVNLYGGVAFHEGAGASSNSDIKYKCNKI